MNLQGAPHDSRLPAEALPAGRQGSAKAGLTIHEILHEYWGFDSFRPFQEEIILSILDGKDTLALMPTGGGKSLCYQVPALAKGGLCLVISPLIALMKDQVQNLRKKNITAYSIYSGMQRSEVIQTLKTVTNSNCKFLYVSPERLESDLFKEWLPAMDINLIAVDEAHCISQWGYDFRPPYLRIAALREELPGVPILALSASATPEVQDDICEKLSQQASRLISKKSWNVFRQSFERPNLSYSVFSVDSKVNKILEVLQRVPGSSIIYCKSRKRTKEISELLQMHKISANFYHAGVPPADRSQRQEDWISGQTRVIVCTNAFGMGIDKPDVRTVIHADLPDCLENYYQEAGRAGRDGKTAYAVLLHDQQGVAELEELSRIRYPSLEQIRQVYQSVANYLQLPSGVGGGQYHDFDIADFMKKFKLNSYTTIYSLRALEQEGWLAFNEQVFFPSRIQFSTNKDHLYEFEKINPALQPLIRSLLRAYEGIFSHSTYISELLLAGLVHEHVDIVKKNLALLNNAGIIEYDPQKDSPQLLLLRNRVRADDLNIDMTAYNKRKEKFHHRVKKFEKYVNEKSVCRGRIIGTYFGDSTVKSCGICDNCLRMKAVSLTQGEFDSISHRILNTVKFEPLPARDLLLKLQSVKKEKTWKVIEFLQAENRIDVDESGCVRLK